MGIVSNECVYLSSPVELVAVVLPRGAAETVVLADLVAERYSQVCLHPLLQVRREELKHGVRVVKVVLGGLGLVEEEPAGRAAWTSELTKTVRSAQERPR